MASSISAIISSVKRVLIPSDVRHQSKRIPLLAGFFYFGNYPFRKNALPAGEVKPVIGAIKKTDARTADPPCGENVLLTSGRVKSAIGTIKKPMTGRPVLRTGESLIKNSTEFVKIKKGAG